MSNLYFLSNNISEDSLVKRIVFKKRDYGISVGGYLGIKHA